MQAKSGTGKTCVFATIALDAVLLESPATQVSRPGAVGQGIALLGDNAIEGRETAPVKSAAAGA